MYGNLTLASAPWAEMFLALALGGAIVVALAAAGSRLTRSAPWQRTLWQVATLALLLLLGVELTGVGRGFARLATPRTADPIHKPATGGRAEEPATGGRAEEPATAGSAHEPLIASRADEERVVNGLPSLTGIWDGIWEWEHPVFAGREWVQPLGFSAIPEPTAGDRAPQHKAATGGRALQHKAATSGRDCKPAPLIPVHEPATGGCKPAPASLVEASPPRVAEAARPPVAEAARPPGVEVARPPVAALWGERALAWFAMVWGAGSLALLARMVWMHLVLGWFRRGRITPLGAEQQAVVAALAGQLGLRRRVSVVTARGIHVPVAFGWLRPTVAVPANFCEEFDPQQQRAVLVHELAHLAAGDAAWLAAADLLCGLLWWHPLVWWLRARLQAASETAADEASLLMPDGPGVLAECLVALGRRVSRRARMGWVSIEGPGFRSGLGRRVERLLHLGGRTWRPPGPGLAASARLVLPVLLVLAAVFSTAWARPRANPIEGDVTMSVWQSCVGRSVAATVLWALLGPAVNEAPAEPPAPGDPAVVAAVAGDLDLAGLLLAQRDEEGEREHPEARRDREEGEREHAEREREGEGRRDEEGRERERDELAEVEEHLHRMMREREEMIGRAHQIEGELRELGDRAPDRRAELRGELERIGREVREIDANVQRGRRELEDAHMRRRVEEIRRRIHELSEAGRHEEAERLKQEGRRMWAEFEERRRREEEGPPPPPPGDIERRLHHLRAAAENLHAAGMHEAAERLMQQAEQFLREHREPGPEGPYRPEPHRPEYPPPPEGMERPPMPDRAMREIEELRRQVNEMREEVQGLREALERLINRQREDR